MVFLSFEQVVVVEVDVFVGGKERRNAANHHSGKRQPDNIVPTSPPTMSCAAKYEPTNTRHATAAAISPLSMFCTTNGRRMKPGFAPTSFIVWMRNRRE